MKAIFAVICSTLALAFVSPAAASRLYDTHLNRKDGRRCEPETYWDGRYDNTTVIWGNGILEPPSYWGNRDNYVPTGWIQDYKHTPLHSWDNNWRQTKTFRDAEHRPCERLELAPCGQLLNLTFVVKQDFPNGESAPGSAPLPLDQRIPNYDAMWKVRAWLAENGALHKNGVIVGNEITVTTTVGVAAKMLKTRYFTYEVKPGMRILRTIKYTLPRVILPLVYQVKPVNDWRVCKDTKDQTPEDLRQKYGQGDDGPWLDLQAAHETLLG